MADHELPNPDSTLLHDPQVTERYCQAITAGAKLEDAAKHAGVTSRIVRYWRKLSIEHRDAGVVSQYTTFFDHVEQARTRSVMLQLMNMQRAAADGSVPAIRWLLERQGYTAAPQRMEVGAAGTWAELMNERDADEDPPDELPIEANSDDDQVEDQA